MRSRDEEKGWPRRDRVKKGEGAGMEYQGSKKWH